MVSPSRKAAYQAVLASLQEKAFAWQILEEWSQLTHPNTIDERFAREIAFGAIRMARTLDYLAAKVTDKQKLSLSQREKALLRTAVYQIAFMDRTKAYAAVNESVKLAKALQSPHFPGFLNAILRKLSTELPALPQGALVEDLGIRFSYPDFFVERLLQAYPFEKVSEILEAGNQPSKTMARKRPTFEMVSVKGKEELEKIASSPEFYIQNSTSASLLKELTQGLSPKKILDLCSAPGGKLLAAHDLFPEAQLFANEVSPERAKRLYSNIAKYDLQVDVKIAPGENYPAGERFDLIILDVPCSNAGVLNKRPEARWRITPEAIAELNEIQLALLTHAKTLLAPNGALLYLTCSILPEENERLITQALSRQILHLPTLSGEDGGFGALLL